MSKLQEIKDYFAEHGTKLDPVNLMKVINAMIWMMGRIEMLENTIRSIDPENEVLKNN